VISDPAAAGRCDLHNLVCGPDGRCVLCHRGDPGPEAGANRLVFGGLAVLSLAVAGSLAYKGLRGLVGAVRDPAGTQAAADAAQAAQAPKIPVRLYTTSWCPHCTRAKKWLTAQHVEYAELDVEHDDWARREHRKLSPRGTVPTFDAYGEVVPGFSPEAYQSALQRGAARRGP
jgi:glutaredoxin